MQNFMELDMKKISDTKALTFGVWGLKPNLGQFGPKTFGKGLMKSLSQEIYFQFSQLFSKFSHLGSGA